MRAPNGSGCISKLPGKRRHPYRVRITTGFETDEHGITRQIQKTLGTYATYQDAADALAEYHRNPSLDSGVTFADVYAAWSKEKYAKSKRSLIDAYSAAFKAVPMLHDVRFKDIKRNHLQNAIDTCGKNYPVLKNIKLLFGILFSYAIQNDIILKDYAQFVDIEQYKPQDKEEIHSDIKPDEIAALWNHTDDETVQEILMLIYSGLRVGEFLALTPDDIEDGFIIVRQAKSRAGRRRVPIAARTALFWQARLDSGINPIITVDTSSADSKARYVAYKRRFQSAMLRVGLPEHLPHDTRHTTATLMHEAQVDPYVVKRILGHSAQDITEKIYTHISDEMLREAINRI